MHQSSTEDFSLGTVEVALRPLERFEEYLQSRGKRITQQRRVLVEQVFHRHEHFDADDLLRDLAAVEGLGPQKASEIRRILDLEATARTETPPSSR